MHHLYPYIYNNRKEERQEGVDRAHTLVSTRSSIIYIPSEHDIDRSIHY